MTLRTWEKHIVKDFNYWMILQRNEAHNSRAQASVLKGLMKYRDFIARIEDESPSFFIPNHVMFSISKSMPTTRNEFRDCCRTNFTAMLLKYQEEIVTLVARKVKSSKEKQTNTHVVFENNVQAAHNPEAKEEIYNTEMEEEVNKLASDYVEGQLPKHKIGV